MLSSAASLFKSILSLPVTATSFFMEEATGLTSHNSLVLINSG